MRWLCCFRRWISQALVYRFGRCVLLCCTQLWYACVWLIPFTSTAAIAPHPSVTLTCPFSLCCVRLSAVRLFGTEDRQVEKPIARE